MTDYRTLYDHDYAGNWDEPFADPNIMPVYTIASVVTHFIHDQRKDKDMRKLVLLFEPIEGMAPEDQLKPLMMNNTNMEIVRGLYGLDYENWEGKRIAIYKGSYSDDLGQRLPCLRVHDAIPKPGIISINKSDDIRDRMRGRNE